MARAEPESWKRKNQMKPHKNRKPTVGGKQGLHLYTCTCNARKKRIKLITKLNTKDQADAFVSYQMR